MRTAFCRRIFLLIITGQNKYECMLSPWRWPEMPTGRKTSTQNSNIALLLLLHSIPPLNTCIWSLGYIYCPHPASGRDKQLRNSCVSLFNMITFPASGGYGGRAGISWNSTGEIGRIGWHRAETHRYFNIRFSARCRPMRPIFPVEFQL